MDLLREHGDAAKLLAGGQSLVPAMNFRVVQPSVLIDLNRLGELDYVQVDQSYVRIGAMTRGTDSGIRSTGSWAVSAVGRGNALCRSSTDSKSEAR